MVRSGKIKTLKIFVLLGRLQGCGVITLVCSVQRYWPVAGLHYGEAKYPSPFQQKVSRQSSTLGLLGTSSARLRANKQIIDNIIESLPDVDWYPTNNSWLWRGQTFRYICSERIQELFSWDGAITAMRGAAYQHSHRCASQYSRDGAGSSRPEPRRWTAARCSPAWPWRWRPPSRRPATTGYRHSQTIPGLESRFNTLKSRRRNRDSKF